MKEINRRLMTPAALIFYAGNKVHAKRSFPANFPEKCTG
jgi:hypothetical protein